jgi:SWI/SNF-related matrix-associated actin-dependent regulator of chromatin subfamily A protein 2/4
LGFLFPQSSQCRYAEIEKFLAETEEYLNKLTATMMEKKVNEVREKAFNASLADSRAQGVSEEAARQAALQAANEAAEKSDFHHLSETMAGDAQVLLALLLRHHILKP